MTEHLAAEVDLRLRRCADHLNEALASGHPDHEFIIPICQALLGNAARLLAGELHGIAEARFSEMLDGIVGVSWRYQAAEGVPEFAPQGAFRVTTNLTECGVEPVLLIDVALDDSFLAKAPTELLYSSDNVTFGIALADDAGDFIIYVPEPTGWRQTRLTTDGLVNI